MKVLVCGDRNWSSEQPILERLSRLPAGTIVIEGDARGADRMAGAVARRLGFQVVEVVANWELHGRAAGPIRNRRMLDMGPDLVIAFHPDLGKSKGTADTVRQARQRGIAVEVIGLQEAPAAPGNLF